MTRLRAPNAAPPQWSMAIAVMLLACPAGAECPQIEKNAPLRSTKAIVQLDPETVWRPRGAEVRFTVRSDTGSTVTLADLHVCFGWSPANSTGTADDSLSLDLMESRFIRSFTDTRGQVHFGATVPDLPLVESNWFERFYRSSRIDFVSLRAVPVARMVVQATMLGSKDNEEMVVSLPVGVTSVMCAVIWILVSLGVTFVILNLIASKSGEFGTKTIIRIISTQDGYASLSQFQIMLWTMVVFAAAVYVMTLAGNLIGITSGTLVLLGISGATALLSRVPVPNSPNPNPSPDSYSKPVPASSIARQPRWADLMIPDDVNGEIDPTRVQMLIFTIISAIFVCITVMNSYEIPEIPTNFVLLMGIRPCGQI